MISIYMPAYQAEKELRTTIGRIPKEFWNEIQILHILDDGSTDATWDIVQSLELENPKIQGFHADRNQGYGATVRKGISLCLNSESEYVVCLHSDGQYAPELLPDLRNHMQKLNLDLLQGSRHANSGAIAGGMPLYKWIAGKVLVFLENRVFGLNQSDYHSGYLLFHRRFLLNSAFQKRSGKFEMDLELIATAKARGYRIGEYAIPTRYAGEQSHLNPVAYGLRVLTVLWRYLMGFYAHP